MTDTEVARSLSLANDWLTTTNQSGTVTNFSNITYPWNNYPWYYQPWPVSSGCVTFTTEEIVLKMSEVERLRTAAKDDKKLRKILGKFTRFIRVEVDFD